MNKKQIYHLRTYFLLLTAIMLFLSGCGTKQEKQTAENTAEKDQPVVIYLTRHGETMYNVMNKIQGWSDTPLTTEGEEIAAKLGTGLQKENITFDAAYSSDLKRATDTASIVLKNNGQKELTINQDKRFREPNYGAYEGEFLESALPTVAAHNGYKTNAAFQEAAGKMYWHQLADTYAAIDQFKFAEDAQTVEDRFLAGLTEIAEKQEAAGGGTILVVSHGMAINILLNKLTPDYEGTPIKNSSVTKITYHHGKFVVETIGDTSFLVANPS